MRKNEVNRVAKIIDEYLEIKPDSYQTLVAFIEQMGWKTIEYNDNSTGDKLVENMDLQEYTSKYPAFLYTTGGYNMILLDAKDPNKTHHLGHEIGHILLKHNYGCLTLKNELEADEFSKLLIDRIQRKPEKIRKYKYGVLASLFLASMFLFGLICRLW